MPGNTPLRQKVTLRDIAAGCGVSRATVSLVLRGSPLVNKHTRARVEDELRSQGYVYNRSAANLRQRTSSSIALVLNDLANPFFAEFAAGVDEVVAGSNFVTLLGSTGESSEREQAVLGSLMEHGPAGIILSPAEDSDAPHVLASVGAQVPLLLFNRELAGELPETTHWDLLALDNEHGARMATEHLLAQGHRRIAFFGGHRRSSSCRQRHAGYTAVMHAAGFIPELVECTPNRLDAAHACAPMLDAPQPPTAAVCYNDAVALGLMLGLHRRGIVPGRDFALTGFDDIAEAALGMPPLTTLAVDPRERGRQAAEMVFGRVHDRSAATVHVVAPVTLVVRASSGPLLSP